MLISELLARYRSGDLTPQRLVRERYAGMADAAEAKSDPAWIACVDLETLLGDAATLEQRLQDAGGDWSRFPLYGIPFAVKDNIDARGLPTTAACPAFAYRPAEDAEVVRRLRAAGALLIGKTNLDQFATGLVGTRSPYGAVPNAFNPAYISGGSSSGSASVVARGLVAFSLGTDTAGSGRVPAGFNNIVGLKPTRGAISARGMAPACRTLDCVSIFALTAGDAQAVLAVAAGFDPSDAYSRGPAGVLPSLPKAPRIGVPRAPEFFGDAAQAAAFEHAVAHAKAQGATIVDVDFGALAEVAALLYQGPWVAERYAAIESWMRERPEALDPTVRQVIGQAVNYSAVDVFKAQYRLEELRREVAPLWSAIDVLMVPTAPTIYTIAQVNADPVAKNSHLGTYTNFVNFLDMSAIAVPASMRADGLPFGVTFIAPAWADTALCALGARWQGSTGLTLGATGAALTMQPLPAHNVLASGQVRVAVVGAHLSGMPLNHQLASRGAQLVREAHTAPTYRLYALPGTTPPKPGLRRTGEGGGAILLELWDMPLANFGDFVEEVPAPLAIGSLQLDDGSWVKGFVCEPHALEGAEDIFRFGGWRAYIASRS
jgi:allophanate hydrolase